MAEIFHFVFPSWGAGNEQNHRTSRRAANGNNSLTLFAEQEVVRGATWVPALPQPWGVPGHWGMRLEMSPPFNHQLGFGDSAGMDGTVKAP